MSEHKTRAELEAQQPQAPAGQEPCVVPSGLVQAVIDFLAMHPEREKELGMKRRFELIETLRKTPTLKEFMATVEKQQGVTFGAEPAETPKPVKGNHKGRN